MADSTETEEFRRRFLEAFKPKPQTAPQGAEAEEVGSVIIDPKAGWVKNTVNGVAWAALFWAFTQVLGMAKDKDKTNDELNKTMVELVKTNTKAFVELKAAIERNR